MASNNTVSIEIPSKLQGRSGVNAILADQATDATVYTVTPTKTFYLTTLSLSAFNTAIANRGDLRLRDGVAGTDKLPFLMGLAGIGALAASTPLVTALSTFSEPIKFTDAVRMEIISGTIRYSIGIVGFEE